MEDSSLANWDGSLSPMVSRANCDGPDYAKRFLSPSTSRLPSSTSFGASAVIHGDMAFDYNSMSVGMGEMDASDTYPLHSLESVETSLTLASSYSTAPVLPNPPSAQAFLPDFDSPLHSQAASLLTLRSPTREIFDRFISMPTVQQETDKMYVDAPQRDEQSVGSAMHALDVDMDVGKSIQIHSQSDDPNPIRSPTLDVETEDLSLTHDSLFTPPPSPPHTSAPPPAQHAENLAYILVPPFPFGKSKEDYKPISQSKSLAPQITRHNVPSKKATHNLSDALNSALQSNASLNQLHASSPKIQPTKKRKIADQPSNASFKARGRGESLEIWSSLKEKKRPHQANRDAGRVSKKVRTSVGASLEAHPVAYLLPTPAKVESPAPQRRKYPTEGVTALPSTREIIDLTASPSSPIPSCSSIAPPREAPLGSPSVAGSKQYRTTEAFNPYLRPHASYDNNTERTQLHITDYAPTNSLAITLNIRFLLTQQLPISPHAPIYRADNGLQDAPTKVEGWLCFPEVPSSVSQDKQPFSTGGRVWMKWTEEDGEEDPAFEDQASQAQGSPRATSSIGSPSRLTPPSVPLPRPSNLKQPAPHSSHARTISSLSTSSFGVPNGVVKVNPKRKPLAKNSTLLSYDAQPLASSSRVPSSVRHKDPMDRSPLKERAIASVPPPAPSPSQINGADPPALSQSRARSESQPIGDPRFPPSAFVGGVYTYSTVDPSFLFGPTPPPPSTSLSHPSPERSLFGDGIDIRDGSVTDSSDDDVPLLLLVEHGRARNMSAASQETKGQGRTSWGTSRLSAKAKGKQPARWSVDEPPSPDIDATFEEAALDAVLPFRELSSGSEYVGSGPKETWKNRSRSPKKRHVKIVDSTRKAKEEVPGKRTIRQPARYRDEFVAHDMLLMDVDESQSEEEEDKGRRPLTGRVSIPRRFWRRGKEKAAETAIEDDDDSHSSSDSGPSSASESGDETVDVKTYTPKPKSKQVLLSTAKDYRDLPFETLESYCHQCRRKTNKCKLNCERCRTKFCNRCLVIRYADRTFEMQSHKAPSCPRCDEYCNCTQCAARRGETYVSSKRTPGPASALRGNSDRVAKYTSRRAQTSLSPTPSPRKGRTKGASKDGGPRVEDLGRPLSTLPTLRLDVPPPNDSTYWGVVYDLDGDKIGSAFIQSRKGKAGKGDRSTRREVDEEVIYATAQSVEGLQIADGVLGPPMLPTVPLEEIRKRWIDPQREEKSDEAQHAIPEQPSLDDLPGNRHSQTPLAPHYIRLEYKRSRTFAGNYQRCWGLKITKASRIKNRVPKVGYVGSRRMLKWKITSEPAQNPDLENDWDEEDAEGEVVDVEEWEEGGQPDKVPLSGTMSPLTDLEELAKEFSPDSLQDDDISRAINIAFQAIDPKDHLLDGRFDTVVNC